MRVLQPSPHILQVKTAVDFPCPISDNTTRSGDPKNIFYTTPCPAACILCVSSSHASHNLLFHSALHLSGDVTSRACFGNPSERHPACLKRALNFPFSFPTAHGITSCGDKYVRVRPFHTTSARNSFYIDVGSIGFRKQ